MIKYALLTITTITALSFFTATACGSIREENVLRDIAGAHDAGEKSFHDYLTTNSLYKKDIADMVMADGIRSFRLLQNAGARKRYEISLFIYRALQDMPGQAQAYKRLGDLYARKGEYDAASDMYGRALSVFEKTRDASGQAAIYLKQGDIHAIRGENDRALERYAQAQTIYAQSHDLNGQGDACKSMADLYARIRQLSRATGLYEKALSLYAQTGDDAGQARVYQGMIEIHRRQGDNAKALASAEKALSLSRKAKDLLAEGDVLKSIGDIHYFRSENSKATDAYGQAFHIFSQAEEPGGQAYVLWRKGLLALRTGDNAAAMDMYGKALALYQKIGDPIGTGRVYFDIGHLSYYKRDFAKALEMYEKALPYYVKADEPSGQGTVFRGMAYIYLMTGDYEKSLDELEKALHRYEKADYPLGQANVYWNMGENYYHRGDHAQALEMYEKALRLFQKVGEPIGQGIIYMNMGMIRLRQGHYAEAEAMHQKSLDIFIKAQSPLDQVKAYKSLGDVHMKRRDVDQALQYYDQGLSLARQIEDAESEAYLLVRKAGILGARGHISEAVRMYEQGIAGFERVRGLTGFTEMKKSYMEKVFDHYQEATLFMIENGLSGKAFRYAEAMKARAFLDQLAEGLVNLEEGVRPELKTRRDGIENRLARLQKQIREEATKQGPDMNRMDALKQERSEAETELEAVRRQIRYENPRYASVQYPEPVAVQELQQRILKDDEVVLEYFVSETAIYCFVVTPRQFEIVRLASQAASSDSKKAHAAAGHPTREAIENDVAEWVEFLKAPRPLSAVKRALAVRLYTALIAPLEERLSGKTVIVVPDGILARLPFESLLAPADDGADFLVEKYRIKYVQSASVLALIRTKYEREGLSDRFIGFGDPVYDYDSFRTGKEEKSGDLKGDGPPAALSRSGYLRSGGKLDRLVGSGKEVREIGKVFAGKGLAVDSHLRAEAKESLAKDRDIGRYGYIHFSTHGILDDKFQAIALSQIPGDSEDGFLTVGEIMNSRYHARLVVLSACQTGLGKMERGEGVTGLTRAVMYAGTPATVVSLWNVSDEGTKELMVHFYENLVNKTMTKDAALREAKRAMRASEEYHHPYYWSAFVMYGE